MEMFQEAHTDNAPGESVIEIMELIFKGAPARRADAGQNASTVSGSAATLNSHGGLTKEGKSAQMLISTGDMKS